MSREYLGDGSQADLGLGYVPHGTHVHQGSEFTGGYAGKARLRCAMRSKVGLPVETSFNTASNQGYQM